MIRSLLPTEEATLPAALRFGAQEVDAHDPTEGELYRLAMEICHYDQDLTASLKEAGMGL